MKEKNLQTPYSIHLVSQTWDLSAAMLRTRFIRAFDERRSSYPIYRRLRLAARCEMQTLFDRFATETGWCAQRTESYNMVLSHDDILVEMYCSRKTNYSSCSFEIWASSVTHAEMAKEKILALIGDTRITDPMFSIDWNFITSKDELENVYIEELADDVLLDEAYPEIKEGINCFIDRYLSANETVLVLQGAPGTGKTRLIRAILGAISKRSGEQAQALYTGDKKCMESDEIFVKFITGDDNAFVVEDADHLLKPRSDGNEHLHRFLTIADGVVRAQGRKIIFSTNLPNVGDLDDALIRPGRCFALIHTRALTKDESLALLAKLLCTNNPECLDRVKAHISNHTQKSFSLAEIYQIAGHEFS